MYKVQGGPSWARFKEDHARNQVTNVVRGSHETCIARLTAFKPVEPFDSLRVPIILCKLYFR